MNSVWIDVLIVLSIMVVAIMASIYFPPKVVSLLDKLAYLLANSCFFKKIYNSRINSKDAISKPNIIQSLFSNSPIHVSRKKAKTMAINTCVICGQHPENIVTEGSTGKTYCVICLAKYHPEIARMIREIYENIMVVKG